MPGRVATRSSPATSASIAAVDFVAFMRSGLPSRYVTTMQLRLGNQKTWSICRMYIATAQSLAPISACRVPNVSSQSSPLTESRAFPAMTKVSRPAGSRCLRGARRRTRSCDPAILRSYDPASCVTGRTSLPGRGCVALTAGRFPGCCGRSAAVTN
jgi:hypothetical protein